MTSAGGSSSSEVIAALDGACQSGAMLAGGVGLVTKGRVTTLGSAGHLFDGGPEAQVSTPFGIGSIGNLLTSIAVARSRSIRFTSTVSEHLSESGLPGVTIEHLLSHSSGLPLTVRDKGPTDVEALERLVRQDLSSHIRRTQPGDLASRAPSGFSVVARILEVTEGRPFDDLLKSLVLDPAGMTRAAFTGDVDRGSVAWPHHREGARLRRDEQLRDDASSHAGGFLFASLEDLVGLSTGILEGFLVDGPTWGRMIRQHATRHISHVPYPLVLLGAGYGLGCQVGTWNGQRVVRQSGRQFSFHCTIDFLPESSAAVILLTNGADDRTFNDLLNRCYEAVAGRGRLGQEPSLEPIPPAMGQSWAGRYVQPSRGAVVDVSEVEDDLVYRDADVEAPLYNVGEGRALLPMSYGSAPVWFPTAQEPSPFLTLWGEPYFREDYEPWEPGDPSEFTGTFRDSFFPRGETDLEIRFEEGTWSVSRDGELSEAVELGERKLASSHGLLVFEEDGSGVQVGDATIYGRS